MHLARFPRRRYTEGRTPLEPMPRLSAELGGPELWIKRDDLTGLGGGGNKTRKLELLVADALARGADTLVTTGAPQSNHCRLTAAAAAKEGLACRLLLEERVEGSYADDAVGNRLLFDLLGVETIEVVPAGTDLAAGMARMAERAEAEGRTPYTVPGGGSNALGALGYAACADELLQQAFELGVAFDHLVTASGSGGTHAGLVAGLHASSAGLPATGVSVRSERAAQEVKILDLAQAACELARVPASVPASAVVVRDDQVGPGYSLPTEAMREAVGLFARCEAILLDPVYTGKAAAGLIAMVREGAFRSDDRVVFVHTGGSAALHAYPRQVRPQDATVAHRS
ncbi:MAG: D-cysteine desulfhydrase [Trueperaceae bacterium]